MAESVVIPTLNDLIKAGLGDILGDTDPNTSIADLEKLYWQGVQPEWYTLADLEYTEHANTAALYEPSDSLNDVRRKDFKQQLGNPFDDDTQSTVADLEYLVLDV